MVLTPHATVGIPPICSPAISVNDLYRFQRLSVFLSGPQKEDLAILCERFTTSKLRAFEDLQVRWACYACQGPAAPALPAAL